MKKTNVYVTGANGFIGKSLINYLNETDEYNVAGISHSENNNALNNVIYSDYKDMQWLKDNLKKNSIIIHTAAHIPNSYEEYLSREIFDINTNIDKFIVNTFLDFADKFIYFSSISIYGYGHKDLVDITEESSINVFNYYSRSKLFGENLVRKYYKNKEYILRLSSPYGLGKNNTGVIEKIIYNAVRNNDIEIYRDGNRTQDYIYIYDICKVIYTIINYKPKSGIYNLSSGNSCSMSELVETIIDIFKSNSNVIRLNKEESSSVSINNRKICKEMNVNFVDIKTGINNLMKSKGK